MARKSPRKRPNNVSSLHWNEADANGVVKLQGDGNIEYHLVPWARNPEMFTVRRIQTTVIGPIPMSGHKAYDLLKDDYYGPLPEVG